MITFVCEEYTEAICQMPDGLFVNLMASLEKGLKEYPLIETVTVLLHCISSKLCCSQPIIIENFFNVYYYKTLLNSV